MVVLKRDERYEAKDMDCTYRVVYGDLKNAVKRIGYTTTFDDYDIYHVTDEDIQDLYIYVCLDEDDNKTLIFISIREDWDLISVGSIIGNYVGNINVITEMINSWICNNKEKMIMANHENLKETEAKKDIIEALKHLRKAWIECNDAFGNIYLDVVNYYILGNKDEENEYPFHMSFDEMNVVKWIDGTIERIEAKDNKMEIKYNELSLEELKKLDGEKLTLEDTNLLDENPNIIANRYNAYHWLSYTLVDNTEINIYYK